MPRRLRYADEALADLDKIVVWLTQFGAGKTARRKLVMIRASIRQLRDHPCRHPVGQLPGVRELPCEGVYRVLYRVHPDTGRNATAGDVRVLRVFGPGQSRDNIR